MKKLLIFTTIILIILTCFNISANNLTEDKMQTINLSQMNLKEKIGQLVIVKPIGLNKNYLIELHVGGIFLNSLDSQQDYMEAIEFYQDNSKISSS